MALREIRILGDDILRKKTKLVKEVNDRTREIIADMIETMRDADGIGLAAPQIGILKRIMIVEPEPEKVVVFINPEILEREGEQEGYEGCLSIPGKSGVVKRPYKITVKAFDIDMKEFELEAEELFARAICHECDHLDGVLYIDKLEGELMDNEELERIRQEEEATAKNS